MGVIYVLRIMYISLFIHECSRDFVTLYIIVILHEVIRSCWCMYVLCT
jgi:hypothetical protein